MYGNKGSLYYSPIWGMGPSLLYKQGYKGGKEVFVAIVPDKDCIINQGDHSVRGGGNAKTLYTQRSPQVASKRLHYPMVRLKGKDSPFIRVSWDEATEFIAERFTKIKQEHGPDALGMVFGDWLWTLPTYAILKFWFKGLGSSSYAGNGWFFDEESAGISAAFGSGTRSFTVEDFEITKLLVTAGTNLQANGSVWWHRFYLKNLSVGKAKHIDIDSRRTLQAQMAEKHGGLHLQIKPGTDPILAGVLIRLVLEKDAYDKDFVRKYVAGFEKVVETFKDPKFSLDNASRATGIPKEKILKAVELMIENRGQSMFLHEKGLIHQMAAFEAQHAYAVLGIILGNVGKPGACTSRAGGHPKGTFAWPEEPPSREHNLNIYEGLEKGKVKALWAYGCNVFKQMPSLTKYRPLMEKTFLVVSDRIHTEMDFAADVSLPAATWGETDLILASEDRRVRILQSFMDPPGEAKPDWEHVVLVAKKMGIQGFDWKSPKDVWDEIRSQNDWIKEMDWDSLLKAGTNGLRYPMVKGKSPNRLYSDEMERIMGKRFFTKDNKIHVEKITVLKDFDPKKYEWGEVSSRYPLMAIDFRLNELWNTGYTYWDTPGAYERTPDAYLLINPVDAKVRGISTGQWVVLESPYGKCKAVARVSDEVSPGVVGMPALFPKPEQEFNYATRPTPTTDGSVDTMVACEVYAL
ncbi:MAG: molybdopterin-dependent oxidoreductase [Aquificaceae bacterium]